MKKSRISLETRYANSVKCGKGGFTQRMVSLMELLLDHEKRAPGRSRAPSRNGRVDQNAYEAPSVKLLTVEVSLRLPMACSTFVVSKSSSAFSCLLNA